MKKISLAIYLILIFSTTTANAYTAFVGLDDSFDLTSVVGFQFNVSGVTSDQLSLMIYYQGDTVGVCGENRNRAVPGAFTGPWHIGPQSTDPTTFWGFDQDFIFLLDDNLTPLSSGIILSLEADTPFSLVNFILVGVNPDGDPYLYDLNMIETSMEGCREGGGMEYTFSVVPIPGSLVLLGSGLIGLIGFSRRRMRK